MRYRYAVAISAIILGVVSIVAVLPLYTNYFAVRSGIKALSEDRQFGQHKLAELEKQFWQVKGTNALRSVKDVIGFLNQLPDIEVLEVKAFAERGGGIEVLGTITSLSDGTLCDGIEITVSARNMVDFIKQLDSGSLTLHSADFMFGTKMAILRVRVGGSVG